MASRLSLQKLLSRAILFVTFLLLAFYFRPHQNSDVDHISKSHHKRKPISRRSTAYDFLTEGSNPAASNQTLIPRDAYSCGPGNPCSNGACCGASGYCGYGSTYCGTGCTSNCNATAECGINAAVPGTTCPLNTCCSQYGFCGTTSDFCTTGCQSNCVLSPSPPAGGSGLSIIQNKVIGYYESWNSNKACYKVTPTDLPLDALTHLNYAFAYIDPSSLQIVTMDSSTPSSLFQDVGNLKSIKPDLQIFVSVGGWSFSDNGTATQPLYGEIAADATKRQTFANNVVHFLKQYGFDGLDIDWEYPGAPDRGGQTQDTANYVSLLQTLRSTFDSSGNKYSLSFTAPSSYWYLRWFDLPSMIKYADWINLMTYDLHGVWDATDPIGSIVQAHTNLTEIKLAVELFWRVNIPPAQIVMGFGFYGRSFTLSNPSCTTPGCPFSGAAKPGPCTATGGILAYYEIMAIIGGTTSSKRATITPTYDSVDAVNYFTFDNDQWVSYDDAVSFKAKVDWANSVGLGGALIWASDLDDDKYSAHAGLIGRSVLSSATLQTVDKALSNPQAVIQDLAGGNGQNCFAYTGSCVNLNDNNAMAKACGSGYTVVGWDDAGCGKKNCHCGKPICCPTNQAPSNCKWRGDNNGQGTGTDCSAQCAPGEVNIKGIGSSWGGGFTNDGNTNKCGRGYKVFCCANPDFAQVTSGCYYEKCRTSCPSSYTSVFSKTDECFLGSQQYCCPDPISLQGCHWTGGSRGEECANAVCNATELEIDRAQFGGSSIGGCAWGRQKAACCTVEKAPVTPASCSVNLCTLFPGYCNTDDNDESAVNYTKRDLELSGRGRSLTDYHELAKRGNAETYWGTGLVGVRIIAYAYPSIGELFGVQGAANILRRFFRFIAGWCTGPTVAEGNLPQNPGPADLAGMQAEHPIDRQIMQAMPRATVNGILPSGQVVTGLPPLPLSFWQKGIWHTPNDALAARPAVGGPNGIQPDTPNDRVMEAFGSFNYPDPFMVVDAQINGPKGRMFGLHHATNLNTIGTLAADAARLDSQPHVDELLRSIQAGFAVFEYLNTPNGVYRWNLARAQIRQQFTYIAADLNQPNLVAWWDLFSADYFQLVGTTAQNWARDAINRAAAPFIQAQSNGRVLHTYGQVMAALEEWSQQLNDMHTP